MKSRILIVIIMGIFSIVSISGHAQQHINKRQAAQHYRIAQGRMQGEISHREAYMLRKQQQRICKGERMAKLDGRITPLERKRLHGMQQRANRSIKHARHNAI